MDHREQEDDLHHRQGARLYPVGRSLRSTFPALDGDDLQPRIASLMIELSHEQYGAQAEACSTPLAPNGDPAPGRIGRLLGHLFRRS